MTLRLDISVRLGVLDLRIAFEVAPGVTAIFGPSGAGKTSIINAISGLLRPDLGRISLGDRVLFDAEAGIDLPPHLRRVGYVFQDGRLFPHLTVRGNLLYGARDDARLPEIAGLLDIAALLDRRPRALSGGEKQRVALGRALLMNPEILLLDEPLTGLDAARKKQILPYLERLRSEMQFPILYVTHAIEEVARLADTTILLGNGRILASGPTAEILSDPGNVRALGIRDAGAVLTARVVTHHRDGLSELQTSAARLLLPHVDASPGTTLRVRIAAQDVILSRQIPDGISALNILPAEIVEIRSGEGPGAIIRLKSGSDLLLARITRRSVEAMALTPGAAVFAVIKSVSVAPADISGGALSELTELQN